MYLKHSLLRHALGRPLELVLLFVAGGFLLLNQWHMVAMHDLLPSVAVAASATASGVGASAIASSVSAGSTDSVSMLPHGIPERYGAELGVNFDDAATAMPILENFDRGSGAITLTGELQQRYIYIASQTACEFCCGATTLVFPDGKPACGCAHSAAMRGVALYLLQQYPEMTDAEILSEVNKWKAAFFPGPTVQKGGATSAQPTSSSGSLPSQVGGC